MDNEIIKRKNLPATTQNKLQKYSLDIQVGDMVICLDRGNSQGEVFRIGKITKRKIHTQHQWDNGDWSHYGSYSYKEFQDKGYVRLDKPIEELELDVLEQLKDVNSLQEEQELSTETALAESGSKEVLLNAERDLVARKRKFDIMQAVLTRKMEELQCIARGFADQLEKVHKVLGVVELYLGVHEKIIQIQTGSPTPANCPLHIRQQVLYMDEEFGDPKDQGLDFTRLREFDEWVCEPENLNRFLPEEKGIVAIRVRRDDKFYCQNPLTNSFMNQENHKTYLLIRNGQNIYRIWTGVSIHRMFPTKEEFKPKVEQWSDGEEYISPFDDERREEAEFEYKKYGLMIQGILHRTQLFQPMDATIDIFKPDTWNGLLVLIRDDELMLPTGKLSWREWRKEINKKIGVGSRIIYKNSFSFQYEKAEHFMRDRTNWRYGEWVSRPGTGLYTAVPGPYGETDPDHLRFFYTPGDTIWRGWGEEEGPRKKRVGFHFDATEVLNYDQLELDDLEFYINSRTERRHYLSMMPLLFMLRRKRKEELEHEKHFVKLVAQRKSVPEDKVWEAVSWWKFKNKWKRPIAEDDAKALRMIERRLKSV